MHFTSDVGGVYVAISRPKREYFVIPAQGCLYNSKLSHQISVRIPKKSTQVDIEAAITVRTHANLTSQNDVTHHYTLNLSCIFSDITRKT